MPLITKILKPEKFNAVEIAIALYLVYPGYTKQMYIDWVQHVLDDLVSKGVLGE